MGFKIVVIAPDHQFADNRDLGNERHLLDAMKVQVLHAPPGEFDISSSKRRTVILFSPPRTSSKRFAPSLPSGYKLRTLSTVLSENHRSSQAAAWCR